VVLESGVRYLLSRVRSTEGRKRHHLRPLSACSRAVGLRAQGVDTEPRCLSCRSATFDLCVPCWLYDAGCS